MTLKEYHHKAQFYSMTPEHLDNGILGLCGEVGELADLIKKDRYQGHDFDLDHAIKELGDVLWYVVEAATGLGVDLEYVAQTNLAKLANRYPDGFDAEHSRNRKPEDI